MGDFILNERHGSIVQLTLNRPEARNALADISSVEQLVASLKAADQDSSVGAVVLTGAGSVFCAGADLHALQAKPGGIVDPEPLKTAKNYRAGIQSLSRVFEEIDVPVIAAVNGYAVGVGLDLACMCDIRIAGRSAKFAASFIKLGLVPADGGAWYLSKILGYSRALQLLLSGDPIDADEALEYQLVSSIAPDDALIAEAMKLARKISANSIPAARMTKALLRMSQHSSLASLMQHSAQSQALAHLTVEHSDLLSAAQRALEKKRT